MVRPCFAKFCTNFSSHITLRLAHFLRNPVKKLTPTLPVKDGSCTRFLWLPGSWDFQGGQLDPWIKTVHASLKSNSSETIL